MISGNNDGSNTGLFRPLYSVKHFGSGRIDHSQKANKYELSLQRVALAMWSIEFCWDVPICDGQCPQRLPVRSPLILEVRRDDPLSTIAFAPCPVQMCTGRAKRLARLSPKAGSHRLVCDPRGSCSSSCARRRKESLAPAGKLLQLMSCSNLLFGDNDEGSLRRISNDGPAAVTVGQGWRCYRGLNLRAGM